MKTYWAIPLAFIAACFLNSQLPKLNQAAAQPLPDEAFRWNPRMFQTLTVGFWPAGVDWLWIRSMLDPSIAHVSPGTHAAIYYTFDLATDLDPAFFDVYTAGAGLLTVVRNDNEGAKHLLKKGVSFTENAFQSYPQSFREQNSSAIWQIYLLLGYVNLFELDNMVEAAEAFSKAGETPGAPPYLQSLGKRFSQPGGSYEVGMRLLNFMIGKETDNRMRARLEKKRDSLYLAQYLFHLNQGFKQFLGRETDPQQLKRSWDTYRKEASIPSSDPWGGSIQLDSEGKITSSTPREKVFGLD